MMGTRKFLATLVSACVLASCGGGGGSPSLPTVLPVGGVTPIAPTPVAADLIVGVDKAVLTNSGAEMASLTVTALDGARNVVAGVPVTVAVDSNGIFTPGTGTTTAADGTFTGKVAIGSDKSNRLIKYTVTSGALVKTGSLSVTGIALTPAAVPSIPAPGAPVAFSVQVKDSAGAPVAGSNVTASGIPGVSLPPTPTSPAGVASFSFAAPAADGIYPISVQSAGATANYDLQVLTAGAGTIAPAVGPVSGASAIANPVVVASNTAGSNTNQSEVRALFITTANRPLPNVRVRFDIISTALPGESLSTGSTLVYSDTTGNAKTSYVAATTSSPNDGVVIRACYDLNDFAAGTCPNSVTTKLTVTSTPVNLTIGTDNKITKTASGISYIKSFEVQAVNAAGNYAADVPLSAVVDVLGYWKAPTSATKGTDSEGSYDAGGVPHTWCINEDINRNGVLDGLPINEDTNGDGFLTPRQSDVAIGFPGGSRTNATGLAQLQLQYPQNLATWLLVKITVTAGVSGSEGSATYRYILRPAEEDAQNGSFLRPPYGSSTSCSNAN